MFVIGGVLCASQAVSSPKVWLFKVTCLAYKSHYLPSFPAQERTDQRLVDALRKQGVAPGHIVSLDGTLAETQRIDYEFRKVLRRVATDETLIVYYTGHGYVEKTGLTFATWNTGVGSPGWRLNRAFAQVDKLFRGKAIVWLADACASGRLVALAKRSRKETVVLTSSSGDESIPEGWTFTNSAADAFEGQSALDSDHDGQVSWGETVSAVSAALMVANHDPGTSWTPPGFSLSWPDNH